MHAGARLVLPLAATAALIAAAPVLSAPRHSDPVDAQKPPSALAAAAPKPDEVPPLPPNLPEGWYAWFDTSGGEILAQLLPEQAPQSVAHFAALAEGRLEWNDPETGVPTKGRYYDGIRVSKAVAGDRFEAGARGETGRGLPQIFVPPEGAGPVNFSAPGRLGMYRGVLNQISAVRFFVTAGSLPYLTGKHPCFGVVVSGKEVVWNIAAAKTDSQGRPVDPVTIRRIRIVKVGNPPAIPDPVPYEPKPDQFGLRPSNR